MNTARFDELLPFYVNGTLSEADRGWMDEYMRENPTAQAELRWCSSLRTRLVEDVPAVSSEVGLERALRRIRTEGPVPQMARKVRGPGLFERVRDWLAAAVPQPMLKPALAAALALVAVQGAVIGYYVERDDASEIRAMKPAVVEHGPYLKVNFKPDAREADIRMLLNEVNSSLAAGPGQLGDYYLRVPEAQIATVSHRLEGSAIVDAVAVVDALPPRQ
jgi:hypothetical protein